MSYQPKYGRAESLTQLIQNQAIYMPQLMGGDLEKAIAKPAELQGYRLEDGLLGEILNDVKGAGSLPLLQFALTELWEKRDRQNHLLTLEQYSASHLGEVQAHRFFVHGSWFMVHGV